jgi:hypothetical protein
MSEYQTELSDYYELECFSLNIRRRSIFFLFLRLSKVLRSLPLRRCLRFLLSGKCSDDENWRRSGTRRRPPLSFTPLETTDSDIAAPRPPQIDIYPVGGKHEFSPKSIL